MASFKFGISINPYAFSKTARLGGTSTPLLKEDNDKFVKLAADSQYSLCAVGDEIEAQLVVADDIAPQGGFRLGSICDDRGTRVKVTLDGLQATPGTGVIAVGDYVVCGTVVARGTSLGTAAPRVCKATAAGNTLNYKWRVVSLDGTTAVGQTALIERI